MVNTFSPPLEFCNFPIPGSWGRAKASLEPPRWVRRTCLKTNKQMSNNKKDSVGNSSDNWRGGGGEPIEYALEWSWCSHRPKARLQGGDGAGQVPEEAMVRTLWEDTGMISTHQRFLFFFLSLRRILLLVFLVLFFVFYQILPSERIQMESQYSEDLRWSLNIGALKWEAKLLGK